MTSNDIRAVFSRLLRNNKFIINSSVMIGDATKLLEAQSIVFYININPSKMYFSVSSLLFEFWFERNAYEDWFY